MFSDYENHLGRKAYSEMGGCYYAQRSQIADYLQKQQAQAGAFVFREVYEGYTPTGVWVCRELTRKALQSTPVTFKTMSEVLQHVHSRTRLGIPMLRAHMPLLQKNERQRTLGEWYRAAKVL